MTKIVDQTQRDLAAQDLATTYFVEAAAGTGKTTTLVARILNAVTHGRARLHEIVAITFTEKAAGELKQRLREELEKIGATEALRDLERAQITTIHSFCASLLRERPVEARVDPQFAVADTLQRQLLLDEAWSDWLEGELTQNPPALRQALMREISIDQLQALATLLVDNRTRLTDDAWASPIPVSLRSVRQQLEAVVPALERCLQHNIAKNELFYQRVQALLDVLPQLEHASEERAVALLSALDIKEPRKIAEFDSKPAYDEAKATAKELKEVLAEFTTAAEHNFLVHLAGWLTGFVVHFQRAKLAKAVLDFDDLLEKARDLLRGNAGMLNEFRQRYQFILVDEFQDTDPVQSEIVLSLGADVPGKLFIVGDPKQSIYGFRRADIEMYAGTRREIAKTGKVLQFQQNFRSQATILDWVNSVFSQLIKKPDDGDYQPEYIPLTARHPASAKVTVLRPVELPAKQKANEVRRNEATGIARYLHRQVAGGNCAWGEVALLFRSFTGVEIYADAFIENGVPFRIVGGRGYYQRQEIQTLISLLCCLDSPNDKLNLVAVLRSVLFGWSDEQIFLAAADNKLSYLNNDELMLLRELHDQRHSFSVAGFVELVFARTHICQAFFASGVDGKSGVANLLKALDLARQVEAAGIVSLRGFVRQLRQTIVTGMDEEPAPANEETENVVRLLTMHKSKGLEFPVVVLADLAGRSSDSGALLLANHATGKFDLRFASCKTTDFKVAKEEQDKRDEAEEIRLLYVATTRAKQRLVIPWFAEKGERLDLLRKVFEPVESALTEIDHGEGEFELPAKIAGNPATALPNRREWQADRATLVARAGKALAKVTPSGLAHDAERVVSEDDLPVVVRERAMELGTAVHDALERMDASGLDGQALKMAERGLKSELLARAGKAVEIYRELPFTLATEDGLMEGKIDLLFREGARWVLVDYKTDAKPDAERYRVQMEAYRVALEKVAGIQVAEMLLLFLATGKVVALT